MSKILKICKGRGLYLNSKGEYEYINTINANDLTRIFTIVFDEDQYTFDEYDENVLHNAADRIIYEKITTKLSNLIDNKQQLKMDVNKEFQELVIKHGLSNHD